MTTSPVFAFDPNATASMQDDFASFDFSNHPRGYDAQQPQQLYAAEPAKETCDDNESMLRHWAAYVAASSILPRNPISSDTAVKQETSSGLGPSRSSSVTFSHSSAPPRRASAPYIVPHSSSTRNDDQLSAAAASKSSSCSRPTSSSGSSKRKLAHLEVERERRRSIACGFANLQKTLHPQSDFDENDGGESTKMMSKSVLLQQACSLINELRVRLEASTTIIASLNAAPPPSQAAPLSRRTSYVNTYTSPSTTDTSPSSVCSTSSTTMSPVSSSWPTSMAMTSIVPSTTMASEDKRKQRCMNTRPHHPPATASSSSCPNSNTASLTNSPCIPAPRPVGVEAGGDPSYELRKAIATLLNCLPVQSEGGGIGGGTSYRTRRNTPAMQTDGRRDTTPSPYLDSHASSVDGSRGGCEDEDVVM